jgi:hypothetical protein
MFMKRLLSHIVTLVKESWNRPTSRRQHCTPLPGREPTRRARRPLRAALALECLEDRLVPAMLTVTSLADGYGPGTLRVAVAQANSDSSFAAQQDTIQFAPDLSGTITLSAPVGLGARGLEIDGSPAITLSGGGTSEVFQVSYGASVSLKGLTITNGSGYDGGAIYNAGSLTLNGDILSGNAANHYGGAIYNAGSLTLNGDTLSGNAAYYYGGGIYNLGALAVNASTLWGNAAYSEGGGIYNDEGGTVVLDASTLSYNSAPYGGGGYGGGLYNAYMGNAFVQDNCTLSGNAASGYGGAIDNEGQLWISGGTLVGNAANNSGGALYNGGSASVQNANLSYNAASGYGGAIDNDGQLWISGGTLSGNAAEEGGAIFNSNAMSVQGANLSYNAASEYGGAVFNSGQLTLSSDWLASNTAEYGGAVYSYGTMTMSNNSVSANTAVQGGGIWNDGSLTLMGDSVSYNYLRQPTASDPYPSEQPQGAGVYNTSYASYSLYTGTVISNNFNADGSLEVPFVGAVSPAN